MSEELIAQTPTSLPTPTQSVMQMIAQAVMGGTAKVEVVQALIDMQIKMEAHAAEVEFNAALARLLPKLPRIEKGGSIFGKDGKLRSKYAFYSDIDLACRPLLTEEGFSVSFDVDDSVPGKVRVTGTLSHRLGFSRPSRVTMPIENPVITGCQAVASAISQAKRNIYLNIFNLICVDDDTAGFGVEPKPITGDQALNIRALISEVKMNEAGFLKFWEISKIEELPERDLKRATQMLEAKRRGQ
jgi:hypothetical protein